MDSITVGGKKYKIHPLANRLPMINEIEFDLLKNDIAANGLQESIILYKDQVIDGRNRLQALNELNMNITDDNIEHLEGEMTDEELESYIASLNLFRRHLTPDQKIALYGRDKLNQEKIKAQERKRGKISKSRSVKNYTDLELQEKVEQRADIEVAKQLGTNHMKLRQGIALQEIRPELSKQIADGSIKLVEAIKQAELTPEEITKYPILKPQKKSKTEETNTDETEKDDTEDTAITKISKTKLSNLVQTGYRVTVTDTDGNTVRYEIDGASNKKE